MLLMLLMAVTPAAIFPLANGADMAGPSQPEGPTYTLRMTLDGGFGATGFGRSIDHTGNRLYLASTDGLRFLDLTTGDIGDFVSRSRFTGPFVVAPDVNRVFAEIDSNRVAFLDASSYEEVGHIPRRDFSRLTYDPARRELYVFAAGASRAEVFDALTAKPVATVELPSWGADGEVLAPGRVFVRIHDEYFVLDTTTRRLAKFPLPRNIGRVRLFADASGRTLFAATEKQLLAFDADTAAVTGVFHTGERAYAAFDPIGGVVLAVFRPAGAAVRKLVVLRHDDRGLAKLSEQDLPAYGQGAPEPTPGGFINGGIVGEVQSDPWMDRRHGKLLIWDRTSGALR
jgi:DNA-binding beta-propeller fold protein YncE